MKGERRREEEEEGEKKRKKGEEKMKKVGLLAGPTPFWWRERVQPCGPRDPSPPKKAHYTLMYGCQAASTGS